ncbi:acetylxylan esterase [Sphingobacterium sp. InxBP1]|uniref:glucuronyl esterase domain-containing protein n=1 Tax=Sphingobacterium sp. InxBP1 TaxID=2870328 RepID=UPI0022430241|nr:acetylxylan esterase [Sphingobacterium sp. InxBP1]
MLKKKISIIYGLFLMLACSFSKGQQAPLDYENNFRQPLERVLISLEERFQIDIKYSSDLVKDRWVDFAPWKIRADLAATEVNLLYPLGLKLQQDKPGIFKLKVYEYHRWKPQEGWDFLDMLAKKYNDQASWERRKAELREGIRKAMYWDRLQQIKVPAIQLQPARRYKDYQIQNFSLEIIPGVYVNGSIYAPRKQNGKIPVVLSPDGHWAGHRYRPDAQKRFITLARMGCMAVSYDLFAWGESLLQFSSQDHRSSIAMLMQTWGAERILDYVMGLPGVDRSRIGISGGSGGGSHSILMSALDDRITLVAPVVSMSSYFFGGCPCESGLPIHFVGGGTNNVELAAIAAPQPLLIISDGQDWTQETGRHDFPYLQKIYAYYGKPTMVKHVHFPQEGHDFGVNKRQALYQFIIEHFQLNAAQLADVIAEKDIQIESEHLLYSFGAKGEKLPTTAVRGIDELRKLLNTYQIEL